MDNVMQKFKQAIPSCYQDREFETAVVGKAFMFARDAGLKPLTAWLQFESTPEMTIVAVVVSCSKKKAIKRLLAIPKQEDTEKIWKQSLPFYFSDASSYPSVIFGTTHSALILKRTKKESIVIFRT